MAAFQKTLGQRLGRGTWPSVKMTIGHPDRGWLNPLSETLGHVLASNRVIWHQNYSSQFLLLTKFDITPSEPVISILIYIKFLWLPHNY